MIEAVSEFVQQHAGSVWVLPVVFGLCALDGFFPPLPSESAVVALAAIAVSAGKPDLWALFAVAAAGAFLGDNIAYSLGRHGGLARLRHPERPRVKRALDWADRELSRRGAMIIVAARYIPVGRVAVNLTAGATRFPWLRFAALDLVAAVTWSAYSIGIGTVAGRWLHDAPLLAAAIGVALAVLLGWLIDRLLQRLLGAGGSPATGGQQT